MVRIKASVFLFTFDPGKVMNCTWLVFHSRINLYLGCKAVSVSFAKFGGVLVFIWRFSNSYFSFVCHESTSLGCWRLLFTLNFGRRCFISNLSQLELKFHVENNSAAFLFRKITFVFICGESLLIVSYFIVSYRTIFRSHSSNNNLSRNFIKRLLCTSSALS